MPIKFKQVYILQKLKIENHVKFLTVLRCYDKAHLVVFFSLNLIVMIIFVKFDFILN